MPAVSALMAKDEVQRVRAYFLRTSAVIWAINLFLMGILLIFSKPLLILWMGDAFASHALSAFRILIIIYASISVNAPAYAFANGLGIPHINALAAISGGVMMIALIFVLGPFWGLVGVALANLGYFSTFIQPIGVSKYLWSYVKETNEQ